MESLKAPKNFKVLMYHRVLEDRPAKTSPWHYVTTDEFEQQMKWLDLLGYNTITFEDYQMYLEGKLTLPKKSIMITFDDGYLDTFTNALPIMRKYNMRGVIFVMGDRSLEFTNWEGDNEEAVCELMSDEQVRIADSHGFEIGAHSYHHLDLYDLNLKKVRDQVSKSRDSLNETLGKEILSFAYPYGRVNSEVQEIVKEEGFKFGCGVYTGPPKFFDNRYDIRRLAIEQPVSLFSFLLKILTPIEYLHWFYNELKNAGKHKKALRAQKENYQIEAKSQS